MFNKIKPAVSFIIMLTWGSCASPIKVANKEASPGFSIANYQTFGFYEDHLKNDSLPIEYHQYVSILQNEIKKQLQTRNVAYSRESPELLVNVGLSVAEKVQTRTTNFGQDAPYYVGQRKYTWKSEEKPVGRYQEGTVTVHLVDRARNELVWKADAISLVPKQEENIDLRIAEGIQKLLTKLP